MAKAVKYLKVTVVYGMMCGLFWSCDSQSALDSFNRTIEEKEQRYEELCVSLGHQMWTAQLQNNETQRSELYKGLIAFLNEADFSDRIDRQKYYVSHQMKRRIEIWRTVFKASRVDFNRELYEMQEELEKDLYRAAQGRKVDVRSRFERLVKMRNEKARLGGFDDYADFTLETTGLGTEWLDDLMEKTDLYTRESYRSLLTRIRAETWQDSLVLKEMKKMLDSAVAEAGSGGLNGGEKSDILSKTLEDLGFCFENLPMSVVSGDLQTNAGYRSICLVIPSDFRMLNLEELGLRSWLHEMGHGLHWMNVAVGSSVLKGYTWCKGNSCPAFCEGMAEMMAGFMDNEVWQKAHPELFANGLVLGPPLKGELAALSIRMQMVRSLFEIELYRRAHKSPEEILDSLCRRYLLLNHSDSEILPVNYSVMVTRPVYEHNFLIAKIMAWQIHHSLKNRFGMEYALDKDVAAFLVQTLFADGETGSWQERLKAASGRELDLKGYLQDSGVEDMINLASEENTRQLMWEYLNLVGSL